MSHYRPKYQFRTEDAKRHVHSLYEALQPWVLDAISPGKKRHRLESQNARGIQRSADSILCDCAAVLAESIEWEGALLAHKLAERGWPIDVELVRACHTWSCSLMDKVMTAHRLRTAYLRGSAA